MNDGGAQSSLQVAMSAWAGGNDLLVRGMLKRSDAHSQLTADAGCTVHCSSWARTGLLQTCTDSSGERAFLVKTQLSFLSRDTQLQCTEILICVLKHGILKEV